MRPRTWASSIRIGRLFATLQALSGIVWLVMLPHEGHGYRARESVMHMLWETLVGLDTYVRPEN